LDSSEEISYGQQVRITAGTINGGGVYFQAQRGTGPFPGTITLNSSPLDWHKDTTHPVVSILNNGVAINRDIEVVANGSAGKSILGGVNTSGTSTFSGTVTLARDLAVTADTGGIVDFSGNVTGGFGVTKEGSGKVVFSTAKSYTGATAVTSGTLVINGTLASSGVTVGDGASLQGAGAITNGLAVSGTVSPGDAIGTLTVGSASFTAGGTLEVEIDGPACDQLLSTGALNLSGAALTIKPSGSSVTEPSYVIAQGSPLTGAFANVPGGFTVTYTGSQAILHAASGYFVSPSGSDTTNNGLSAATPFATIQKAANLMVAGDTCFIRGGIYRETVTVPNSGTASSPITFAAYNNEKVIISGTDPITDTWAEESENVWYVDIPYLTREVWTNVTGSSVANIPVGTTPTFTDKLASFETPTNWADNFGTRVSGVFTAPADGDYTFWIASDDNSQLWLSTNSSPANKQLIAAVNSYTISREWTKFPSQKSVAVSLVQGQQYYIEALQKENAGGDNLAVAWARPGQPTTVPSEIIPGSVFSSVPGAFSFTLGDRNQVFQGAGTQASLAMKPEARWPNAGAGHPWQDSTIKPSPDWTYVDSAGYDVNGQNGWLIDAELPSRPAPANYWAGARVHIMLGEGWYTFTPSVNSYDDSTKTLVTDENHGPVDGGGPGAYTMKTGNEYYLTGKKGELDSEGEWFYDNISSRLCFYSTAAPANVEVKSRLYGFKFSGKSFINLTNLDFFACTVDPTAPYPTDCELDGLNMKYLSHHRLRDGAVGLALGSRCVLRNSELAYCSNGLVAMQGSDMRIINNYLHDAAYTPVGVGAIVANVYGANQYAAYRNLISHNTIRKVGHAAITYPGRAAIIQYNDVSDAMKGCTDGGIFYWNQDGSNGIVRYNLVHDSAPAVGHTGAGMRAFYLDNQSSGWIAHHNIIWNVIGHAMHYNARTNFNKIFNNTCWNCSGGAVQSHFWGDGPTGSSFFNNLFNGKADGNQATWSVTDMRHNLHTDPSLVDPANRDFRLQASSPGIDAGTVIPGVTDGYAGSAPDLGALEYGVPDWTDRAGYHAIPPTPDPVHDAPSLSFANQISDGSFESGNLATAWVTAAGSNVGVIRSSSWYDPHLRSGHHGVQFGGGESEISQVVTGLIPNRRYKFHCGTHKTDPSAVVVLGVRSFGFPDREFTVPVTNPWQQNVADPVGVIFEVPFVTGPTDTSATVYVKVTRPAGSSVAPKNNTTGTFPTTAATLINLSNYYNSVLVNPWYPETGVYVDDLAVLLSQENTDPLTYGMPAVSYPFDESGGVTAYDVTPNENSAVLTGATFTPGQHGNALTFTGITQKATATTATIPAAGGSFSVAFWLKLNNIAANEYPKPVNNAGWLKKGWHITSGPDYSLAMYLWTKDNSQGTDNPKTGISCSTQALAAGVWAHVTFVFDRANGVVKSFRNGKLTNTATIPAGFGDIATTGGLQIGTGFSNGQMDDFQLWNYALNDKAVADVIGTDPSLALRLKLDDEAGATKAWDSSSYRRTGDLTNMTPASAWVGGRINGALEFDGVNDHVATPAISSPEAVTVACWAKSATPAWNASGCLVSQRPAFVLSPEQGGKNLRFIIYDSPTTEIATPTWVPPADFDITLWHHYAGVFDPAAGRLELYVDGVLVSFLSTTATLNADTGAVFIGKDDNAANYFNGAVDDVRIHSRALSWWEMLELSLQINTQPYAETPTIILATDVDGDRLPGAWEQFYGLDPQVANNPADDSGDHDGLGLLMEYALNQNPSSDSSAGLPIINTELNPGDGKTYLTFTYLRRTDAPQVTYAVQVSDDLLSWSSAPAESLEISAVPSGDGVTEIVTTRILPAIGASNPRRMARLSVSPP
jgi:autotransporter-associated beta strand protein